MLVKLEEFVQIVEGINFQEFVCIVASHAASSEDAQEFELCIDCCSFKCYVKFVGWEKDLVIFFFFYQLNEWVCYDVESDILYISGFFLVLKKQFFSYIKGEDQG